MASIKVRRVVAGCAGVLALALAACGTPSEGEHELEVFSWWTSGSEAAGLQALADTYVRDCPGNTFVNSAIAGGTGSNSKQVLASRLQQNDPPSTFQVHGGMEAVDYIDAGQVEDLSQQYQEWGLAEVFPTSLVDAVSRGGKPYSVPANIHRIMLWSNTDVLQRAGISGPVNSVEQFVANLEAVRAAGVQYPLAVGVDWTQTELLESVLLADLGPERFAALWNRGADWNTPEITRSLQTYQRLLGYANPDRDSLDWTDAQKRLTGGTAGYQVMGDWMAAEMDSQGFTAWSAQPFPGTEGAFQWLADAFVLPTGARDAEGAQCWLRTVASAEGQKAFNTKKGSIPARLDADPADYPAYQRAAIADFRELTLAPSCAHGSACTLAEGSAVNSAIGRFSAQPDVPTLQRGLHAAVDEHGPAPAGTP